FSSAALYSSVATPAARESLSSFLRTASSSALVTGAAGLALAPGVGSGAGAAKAVPGAASTVTAQTTATATVTNPRFPLPVRVPGAVPMTHSPNWLTVGNVRSPG